MTREFKGNSIIALPDDFVVIDTETTGLDYHYCNLIEVSAIRYCGGKTETFSSLVKPPLRGGRYVDEFIEQLTGITNDMLANAPAPGEVIPLFADFIGDSLLVGHNVGFDVNFLYDAMEVHTGRHLSNDHINTVRMAHKLLPNNARYRLCDVAPALGIEQSSAHRGLADCETTLACYLAMKEKILAEMTEDDFRQLFVKHGGHGAGYRDFLNNLSVDPVEADESSPIYGKVVVFTGTLDKMPRKQALELVAKIGGVPADSLTAKTNFLVIGKGEFVASVKDGKTTKMKKAEALALKGNDIRIISEDAFFDLIDG